MASIVSEERNNESERNRTMSEQQEIKLTLDPQDESETAPAQEKQPEVKNEPADQIEEAGKNLSEEEKKTVDDFAEKIDITQSNTVLQYGSAAQKKVSDFSDTALKNVRTKDLGEVGDLLTNLVTELKNFDTDTTEKKGFFSNLFDRSSNSMSKFQAKYSKAESNVDKVSDMLEKQQIVLLKDIALLDQLYERNQQNTKELTMYILAGRKKLQEVRSTQLPALTAKAKQSGLPEDAQAANDLEQACVRFEKKLYDLELTRQVSIQMAPQIRMVQNNDTVMTEKIQSTLVNTIPLWKNQIVLSLGIQHSKEAMEAQREVSNMTNELLKKNAETLHQATVDTAKESERGIVDIETLQHTNKELISTLDDILNIQKEGREKRQAAEQELNRIENELSDKLLEINSDKAETK